MTSNALLRAINSENNNGEIYVKLIEISGPAMDTLRYCDAESDITSDASGSSETYIAIPMTLPEAGERPDDTDGTVTLEIDNTDPTLGQTLIAVPVTDLILVKSWRVLASQPNIIERSSEWVLRTVDGDALTLQITLGRDPVLDEGIPYLNFTPGSNPGLFHDSQYIPGQQGGFIPPPPPPPPAPPPPPPPGG